MGDSSTQPAGDPYEGVLVVLPINKDNNPPNVPLVTKKSRKKHKKVKKLITEGPGANTPGPGANTKGPGTNTNPEDGVNLALARFYTHALEQKTTKNNGQANNGHANNGHANNGQANHGQANHGQANHGQANHGQNNNGPTPSTHPKEKKENKDNRMEREVQALRHLVIMVANDDTGAIAAEKVKLVSDSDAYITREEVNAAHPSQNRNAQKYRIEEEIHELRLFVALHDKEGVDKTTMDMKLQDANDKYKLRSAQNETKKNADAVKAAESGRVVTTHRNDDLNMIETEIQHVRSALISQYSESKDGFVGFLEAVKNDSNTHGFRAKTFAEKQATKLAKFTESKSCVVMSSVGAHVDNMDSSDGSCSETESDTDSDTS